MAGKKWPESKKITIKLLKEHVEKKPDGVTMTEWIRRLIDAAK